jgi:predicted tellurium resistance membrane protein TerC
MDLNFDWIDNPEAWVALGTLTVLEIVLGIDNIIFIGILVSRLPMEQRQLARLLGLSLAMISRIALLLSLAWMMNLTAPLFSVYGMEISGRDIVLVGGGLFLLVKATLEIHNAMEGVEETTEHRAMASMSAILIQIAILDIVFSLDSVITAVGLVEWVSVMVIAIMVAVLVMMLAAKPINEFIDGHPTVKMLALSFLVLVGVALIGEGLDMHIPRGYIYFAMAFSFVVEMLNIRLRKKATAVELRKRISMREKEE